VGEVKGLDTKIDGALGEHCSLVAQRISFRGGDKGGWQAGQVGVE
jgi:hypothetical protein